MSITTWIRLEPTARDPDLRTALQARVADPLWLLGRQWQLGEREAEDTGSPVLVELEGEVDTLSRFRAGAAGATPPAPAVPYDPRALPLEAVVEREPARGASRLNQRLRAEAGLHFLRLLSARGQSALRGAYLSRYALTPLGAAERGLLDEDSLRFLDLIERRSMDGARLYADLLPTLRPPSGPPGLPPAPPVPAAARPAVIAAGLTYLQWFEALFIEPAGPESAWGGDRLEYNFQVAAAGGGGEMLLAAPAYTGGRLDWTSFDHDRGGATLGASTPAPAAVHLQAVPTPITFKGMPAHRHWEMEDGQVNLDGLEVAPVDLPRMLLAEFVFLHGHDWLYIPWSLEVGSLARVDRLRVQDSFGDSRLIPAARELDPDWAMFRLSEANLPDPAPPRPFADLLFVPPTLLADLAGRPLEDVVFARDQMANMSWAIERVVEGPRGLGLDRHEAFQAKVRRSPAAAPPAPGTPPADAPERTYRLQSTIPDYWIPMVPIHLPGSSTELRLRRGLLDRAGGPLPALGRVLAPERALILHPEEIPRVGTRVVRSFRLARWTAGQIALWIRRRKSVSRGGASSGLRYDFLA